MLSTSLKMSSSLVHFMILSTSSEQNLTYSSPSRTTSLAPRDLFRYA